MKNTLLIFVVLMASILSCKKQESEGNNAVIVEQFVGEYEVQSIHVFGLQTFYDSIGNQINQGYDTSVVDNEFLSIEALNNNDSLLINGLINNFNNATVEVKGVLSEDTLNLIHDFSLAGLSNNYIRGNLWFENDSLFLDYYWDKSDVWSDEALPVIGEVRGRGVKK